MEQKVHITPDRKIMPCKAHKRPCKYGSKDHFPNVEDAQEYIDFEFNSINFANEYLQMEEDQAMKFLGIQSSMIRGTDNPNLTEQKCFLKEIELARNYSQDFQGDLKLYVPGKINPYKLKEINEVLDIAIPRKKYNSYKSYCRR